MLIVKLDISCDKKLMLNIIIHIIFENIIDVYDFYTLCIICLN